jgi:hypothetical protein
MNLFKVVPNSIVRKISSIKNISRKNISKKTYPSIYDAFTDNGVTGGLFSKSKYCAYCKGTGNIRCYTCNGNGKVYMEGMKEYICDDCNRGGMSTCTMCCGYGMNYIS